MSGGMTQVGGRKLSQGSRLRACYTEGMPHGPENLVYRRESAPTQRRHHRPRRSREDDASGRPAASERHVPGQRAGGRARDRQTDLERERGITILAKNTAVHYKTS